MKTLQEAWTWYEATRRVVRLMRRLGERYWNELPWEGFLARDEVFRNVERPVVIRDAEIVRRDLDDLAVIVLFSVFEAEVRRVLADAVEDEARGLRHPLPLSAG